jgi:hypothetical protein
VPLLGTLYRSGPWSKEPKDWNLICTLSGALLLIQPGRLCKYIAGYLSIQQQQRQGQQQQEQQQEQQQQTFFVSQKKKSGQFCQRQTSDQCYKTFYCNECY